MKKRQIHLMLWAVAAVLLLASCSKVPKSAKLIPEEAMVVMRFDVKQLVEKSGFDDDSKAKKKLTDALKEADMSREAREKAEAILDDPAQAGLDLRDPLFFYGAEIDSKEDFGLVGSILNKDDFTSLLNTFGKEAGLEQVKTKDGLSYFAQKDWVVVYDNDCFYIGERKFNQSAEELVTNIAKKFNSDGKQTMAESDDMKKLCAQKGVMQLLLNGEGMTDHSQYKKLKEMLAKDLKMEDVSYLMDLSVEKGEASLTTEVIAKSEAWKELLAKGDKVVGKVGDSLTKYISNEGFAAFANFDGAAFYDMLKDMAFMKEVDAEGKTLMQNILKSMKGDMAVDVTDVNTQEGFPIFDAYIQTTDNTLVKLLTDKQDDEEMEKTADGFKHPSAYAWDETSSDGLRPVAWNNVGFKNNITYFIGSDNPVPFKTAAKPFPLGDVKGKGVYVCFNFGLLDKIAKKLDGAQGETLKQVAKYFDIAELYYEGEGKAVLHVVMKDKEHTPLESLIDLALGFLDYQVVES